MKLSRFKLDLKCFFRIIFRKEYLFFFFAGSVEVELVIKIFYGHNYHKRFSCIFIYMWVVFVIYIYIVYVVFIIYVGKFS